MWLLPESSRNLHTTVLSAIEVSFGANGDVDTGERIVALEPEEARPYRKSISRGRSWKRAALQ
jgi:hypothetical protein